MTDYDRYRQEVDRILAKHGISYPRGGFDIGMGWLPHVERAIDEMVAAGWDKHLSQVKQKFGGLRIYIGGAEDEAALDRLEAIIRHAEFACAKACEECGADHGLQVPLSGMALCAGCSNAET